MSTIDCEDSNIFEKSWDMTDFHFGKLLGKGRFGRVYVAKEIRTKYQHLVAIKMMSKDYILENNTTENLKRECDFHLKLKHPNIIEFYGWFHDKEKIYFILEYAPKGNLYGIISKGPLRESLAATYILQTSRALNYIHSRNIIHRDLKPENILIGNFGEIKLADFGWANKTVHDNLLNEKTLCKSIAGTVDYLCPEVILNQGHSKKVDIWCLGVLCFEMLVSLPPFTDDSDRKTYNNILNLNYEFPKVIGKQAKELISKILVKIPDKRPSLEEIMESKWIELFADKDDTYMLYYKYD